MSYKILDTGLSSKLEASYIKGKLVNTIQKSNTLVNPNYKYIHGNTIILNSQFNTIYNTFYECNKLITRFPMDKGKLIPYEGNHFRVSQYYNRFYMVYNPLVYETDFIQVRDDNVLMNGFYLLVTDITINGYFNLAGYINQCLINGQNDQSINS